jgi:hypothetical protein
MPTTQTFSLTVTPQDRAENPYRLVPFEVPPGIAQVTVRYTYCDPTDPGKTGKASDSIVDLGLFDPRGHAFLEMSGFRGWSGGKRSEATLSATEATPGYLPGPIWPGTWQVLLGLYQIAPQGCTIQIAVELEAGKTTEMVPESPDLSHPTVPNEGWYCGDLHCHTYHSDADADVETLVTVARAQGLDFVALTEHNTTSHLADLQRYGPEDPLLIPGIEITTYRGHANVWGIRSPQEFRIRTEDELWQVRERVREQGLLFSINHPKDGGPPWEYQSAVDADAVEGWQAPWWFGNYQSLAFWDELLRRGKRPTLVGGSDKHQGPFQGKLSGYELGTPTTWVYARERSEEAILEGIRDGHVCLSRNPGGVRLFYSAQAGTQEGMVGDTLIVTAGELVSFRCRVTGAEQGWMLRIVHRHGEAICVPVESTDWEHTWQVTAGEDDYYRVEIIDAPDEPLDTDPSGLVAFALSNPIYLRIA